MKLLLIDPTLAHPAEAAKVKAFAQIEGISLQVLTGDVHGDDTRKIQMGSPSEFPNVPVRIGRTKGKFPNRTFMLSGLSDSLRHKPDVILAYSDWDHLLTLQIALAKLLFAPQSKLIFQGWENQPRSFDSHPQPSNLLYLFDKVVEKMIYALADAAIGRSPEAADIIRQRGFKGKICMIPWGIDVDMFHSGGKSVGRAYTIGYVGRLVAEKGIADIIQAVSGMPNVRVVIVGKGPEEPILAKSAQKLNVDIDFIGAVPQEKLPEIMSQMDLFVLPSLTTSRWAEQFGRALVEAMAVGAPVIGSDSGAIPWVIGDPDLIYPEGDAAVLRKLILKIKENPAFAEQKSRALMARARKMFNWTTHAETTVSFCREIV